MIDKVKRKLRSLVVNYFRHKPIYYWLYKSWWHANIKLRSKEQETLNDNHYYTAVPHKGAGIGHQMANWIAGYWFAKEFGINYAHSPFSTEKWDFFLGFGANEIKADDLLKEGYKKVVLPLFDEYGDNEIDRIKKIIKSYKNNRVLFVSEQDQFYKNQYGVITELQTKFFNAKSRKDDKLIFDSDAINIAVHVRRGDIVVGLDNQNENLLMRWQDNDYFKNVLTNALSKLHTQKEVHVYIFSQGNRDDFKEFEEFENIHFCLEMNAMDSFLHMVYADILITSKSSFSYKPALLNRGVKISPRNFWHGYPPNNSWILTEEDGSFNELQITLNLDEQC